MRVCSANRRFFPSKKAFHSLKMALCVCNRQIANELPTPGHEKKGGDARLAAPSLLRLASPRRATPRLASPSHSMPAAPCLARPSLAIPGHALPARPGLASPSRAWPRHALPCLPCDASPRLSAPCPAAPRLAGPSHARPGIAVPTNVNSLRRASAGVNGRED